MENLTSKGVQFIITLSMVATAGLANLENLTSNEGRSEAMETPDTGIDRLRVDLLKGEYTKALNAAANQERLVSVATAIQQHHGVPEGNLTARLIQGEMEAGSNIAAIKTKAEARLQALKEHALHQELLYRTEEAKVLRQEVGTSVTDEDILRVTTEAREGKPINLYDPTILELRRREKAGENIEVVIAQARNRRATYAQNKALLAELRVSGKPNSPFYEDAQSHQLIATRKQAGEAAQVIQAKTQHEVDEYEAKEGKKKQLAQDEMRIAEINLHHKPKTEIHQ